MPTVEVAPRGPRPPIRVRPAPRCEPPFDDELEPEVWATANQLAFEWPRAESAEPAAAATPHWARSQQDTPASSQSTAPEPANALEPPNASEPPKRALPPIVAGASGDAKLAVRRFVHMCVEVLNGYRPAAHLRRLSLPKEAADVVAQATAGTSRVAQMRRSPRTPGRRTHQPGPVAVIRLRLCEPRPGAVEAAVLLVTGERTWAMALRLEMHQQNWCATTLRLI